MPSARRTTKSQPSPHDAFFRHILARTEAAAEFLRWYLPAPLVAELDLTEVSLADTAFADAKLRKHFSDLLLRVRLRTGGEAYVLILLEHKSAPDPRVAIQVLRYSALTWDRLPLPLPLIIPVVVYHGAKKWRIGKKFSGLFGVLPAARAWLRYLPNFEYHLCDLSNYDDDELHGEGGLAAKLKLLKYIFRPQLAARLPEILKEVEQNVSAPLVREEIETMLTYLEKSGRADEETITNALAQTKFIGEDRKSLESILMKIARASDPEAFGRGMQQAKQEAIYEMTVTLLEHKLGNLTPTTLKKIQHLSVDALKSLSTALLAFHTRKDLDKWLRQHPQTTEQQN